jgi:hypothetical protein
MSHLWRAGRMICVAVALLGVLSMLGSCAPRQPLSATPDDDTFAAQPLDEDDSLTDKAGEVGVVGLAVAVIAGGILLPILLL